MQQIANVLSNNSTIPLSKIVLAVSCDPIAILLCARPVKAISSSRILMYKSTMRQAYRALHDTFAAFGKVLSCKVATDARAIRTANGMLLNDKKISVCHYIYRNERRSKAEMRAHFIDAYIKNIDSSDAKEEFEAPFQQFGDIPDNTKDVSVGSPMAIVGGEDDDPSGTIQTAPEAAVQPSPTPKDESEPCSPSTSETPTDPQPQDVKPELAKGDLTFALPIAEKISPERDVSLSDVQGTDSEGRIPHEDAEKHKPPTVATAPATAEYVDIPIPNMREVVGARLTQSKQELPYHYLTVEINMDEILKLREVFNRTLGEKGKTAKLSVNDFILKGVACALADVPEANSAWLGEVIRRYNTADISMAVATPTGLITPIVKDVGSKGIATISVEAEALAKKARDGRLTPQECQGGTFTVSNLGTFDIDQFTAIINPAQSCNLAVGSMKSSIISSPEEERGFKAVNIMKVTLCSDHRVVDSAIGAHWMSAFKGYLENPLTLML
ncbi:2-oxoacid dehydrogenases acyltransferase-domain-containing protein [Pisolithus marmoratus]|nr:2-oxoacid dehydrogenases acyltransferase-domain-containing protein [Pisolithus marmoratus]